MPLYVWLSYVLQLAAGIQAIQSHRVPVSFERAVAYAVAATYHGQRKGIDPFELVAVARNESDFVATVRGPDGKDCGLTQTRTTVSRYTCRQLERSYWIAFAEAARELSEYRDACRRVPAVEYDRCRINKYNSGARYSKTGVHGRYYLRVMCFAEAARSLSPVDFACRRVHSRRDIPRIIAAHPSHRPSLATAEQPPQPRL